MVRLVIGEHEQTGWCVARINKENHDADIMVLEEYGSMTKAEAWDKAWELNDTYGENDYFFMAFCKIDLEPNEPTTEYARWEPKEVPVRNGKKWYNVVDYICSECGFAFSEEPDECPGCHRKMIKNSD